MTDSLIVLNGNDNFGGEGFFKFENGYRNMTVCFQKISRSGQYMWAATDAGLVSGAFPPGKTVLCLPSSLDRKPKKCGIFFIEDGKAYTVLAYGDDRELLADFCRQNKLEAGNTPNAQIAVETPVPSTAVPTPDTEEPMEEISAAEEISEPPAGQTNAVSDNKEEKQTAVPASSVEPNTYWDCNKDSFLKILQENPEEEEMNVLIPGSRWVKVNDDGARYIMGVIYDEEGEPLYLCYGFSEPWSETPPENLDGYSQWIPLDCAKPHDEGYWVIYINAKTGERVR